MSFNETLKTALDYLDSASDMYTELVDGDNICAYSSYDEDEVVAFATRAQEYLDAWGFEGHLSVRQVHGGELTGTYEIGAFGNHRTSLERHRRMHDDHEIEKQAIRDVLDAALTLAVQDVL